ncbi:hypothetical protein Rcae01_05532 [Novipirellula caenicola]|uniref:Uncharacterized protein n=1 Tax=Novipirellula caenicola TaxID=1536901 RepID=A0ABP9VYW7_9BACT
MSKVDKSITIRDKSEHSPVITLLLAQYRNLQTERIVLTTSTRVLWFTLLLALAITPNVSVYSICSCFLMGFVLLIVSLDATRRNRIMESSIRHALVRLDPDREDYYIRVIHGARVRPSGTPVSWAMGVLHHSENLLWCVVGTYVLVGRVIELANR